MSVNDFVSQINGFYGKTQVEQLLMLAWFAEARQGKTCFDGAHLRESFRAAGADAPNMSIYLPRLAAKKPPQLVKDRGSYRLTGQVRRELDRRLGGDVLQVAVAKSLADLPLSVPDLAERTFLSETLACYKAGAFRATTIMAWNLAYDHLTKWATSSPERLARLNDGITRKVQGKAVVISSQKDLNILAERLVVECCQVGGLLDKNQTEVLLEKLKRRNAAAHPSSIIIGQHQTNDTISDLVNNIVLALR